MPRRWSFHRLVGVSEELVGLLLQPFNGDGFAWQILYILWRVVVSFGFGRKSCPLKKHILTLPTIQ